MTGNKQITIAPLDKHPNEDPAAFNTWGKKLTLQIKNKCELTVLQTGRILGTPGPGGVLAAPAGGGPLLTQDNLVHEPAPPGVAVPATTERMKRQAGELHTAMTLAEVPDEITNIFIEADDVFVGYRQVHTMYGQVSRSQIMKTARQMKKDKKGCDKYGGNVDESTHQQYFTRMDTSRQIVEGLSDPLRESLDISASIEDEKLAEIFDNEIDRGITIPAQNDLDTLNNAKKLVVKEELRRKERVENQEDEAVMSVTPAEHDQAVHNARMEGYQKGKGKGYQSGKLWSCDPKKGNGKTIKRNNKPQPTLPPCQWCRSPRHDKNKCYYNPYNKETWLNQTECTQVMKARTTSVKIIEAAKKRKNA
jgi:hypothetical protein